MSSHNEGMRRFEFWVDGACAGNQRVGPQPMGGGVYALCDGIEREWAIPLGAGTNQLAEIMVVTEALRKIRDRSQAEVIVHSDSEYAIGVLTKPWKPKANLPAIVEAKALIAECGRFRMVKVPGHAGVPGNERADKLAVAGLGANPK